MRACVHASVRACERAFLRACVHGSVHHTNAACVWGFIVVWTRVEPRRYQPQSLCRCAPMWMDVGGRPTACLAHLHDGATTVIAGGTDGIVRVWTVETQRATGACHVRLVCAYACRGVPMCARAFMHLCVCVCLRGWLGTVTSTVSSCPGMHGCRRACMYEFGIDVRLVRWLDC